MNTFQNIAFMTLFGIVGCMMPTNAQNASISIDVSKSGNRVSPSLYGIFFEEINHSGDGGLYAELIRNRSFEDSRIPDGWHIEKGKLVPRKVMHHFMGVIPNRAYPWHKSEIPGWQLVADSQSVASASLTTDEPFFESAPTNLVLDIKSIKSPIRLQNKGFWGIGVKGGENYRLRTIIKKDDSYRGEVIVKLLSSSGETITSQRLALNDSFKWQDVTQILESATTDPEAVLSLEFNSPGKIWLDYVSLMPENTFNKRPNGMRDDIAKMLVNMKPAFMRWPGGCIVGGITLDNRFNWKKTLGDPASRPGEYITWGERCSYGFGYHEMLEFCEDLNMDAMYVCNAGMSDMFRSGELCSDDCLQYYIDDCLDAIEYALGDTDTYWGNLRAQAGHPDKFPLKYVEVGNELHGPAYEERFNHFYEAIKAKYPQVVVISNAYINGLGRIKDADMVDPHWYGTPNFYFNNTTMFDSIPREGHTAYIGEWACNFNVGKGNVRSALAEAAFLTGVERNGDYVTMTSYAPLLQNRHDKDWNVNLIHFDSDSVFGRASYYVQCMASQNRVDRNVEITYSGKAKSVRHKAGKMGFGSSKSPVEIKNVSVVCNGTTIVPNLNNGEARLGEWNVTDEGTLLQTSDKGNSLYILNEINDDNYVMECDVCRRGKNEGVFIFYALTNDIHDAVRYNIGGFNCQTISAKQLYDGMDVGATGNASKCLLLPDEWHHVKLVVTPEKSILWVDGKEAFAFEPMSTPEQFVNAGIDEATGELVIKVVNRTDKTYSPEISLYGVKNVATNGKAITLMADDDTSENSFADPLKIAPKEATLSNLSTKFIYDFKPYSYTIIRINPL